MKHLVFAGIVAILLLSLTGSAQQNPTQPAAKSATTSYLFVQSATASSAPRSEETFRKIVDELQKFLAQKGAALSGDPTGMNSRTYAPVPLDKVLQNAKGAGAAMALYGTIELAGKSVVTKLEAYTLDGNKMWETGGSCDMGTSVPLNVCVKVATETMYEMLKFRIQQQDLPLVAEQKQK